MIKAKALITKKLGGEIAPGFGGRALGWRGEGGKEGRVESYLEDGVSEPLRRRAERLRLKWSSTMQRMQTAVPPKYRSGEVAPLTYESHPSTTMTMR